MRPFRFRAKAVLTIRRRRDDEAQAALGRAVVSRVMAEQAVDRATVAVDEATLRARDAQTSADFTSSYTWHRNWILCCQHRRAVSEQTLKARRQTERRVRAKAHEARRALRAVERWHDRALQEHTRETQREEQREFDELGALRFTARRRAEGGMDSGN